MMRPNTSRARRGSPASWCGHGWLRPRGRSCRPRRRPSRATVPPRVRATLRAEPAAAVAEPCAQPRAAPPRRAGGSRRPSPRPPATAGRRTTTTSAGWPTQVSLATSRPVGPVAEDAASVPAPSATAGSAASAARRASASSIEPRSGRPSAAAVGAGAPPTAGGAAAVVAGPAPPVPPPLSWPLGAAAVVVAHRRPAWCRPRRRSIPAGGRPPRRGSWRAVRRPR